MKEDSGGGWHLGPEQLDPHERVSLQSAATEDDLVSDQPGTMRVRLRYDGRRRYRSPWLEIQVVP